MGKQSTIFQLDKSYSVNDIITTSNTTYQNDVNQNFQEIISMNSKYLRSILNSEYENFVKQLDFLKYANYNKKETIKKFSNFYIDYIESMYQSKRKYNFNLQNFIETNNNKSKMIWGDSNNILDNIKLESIDCMVTSPPYYNAREYSQWENLNLYLNEMKKIIKKCYDVLKNHRVFVFNVGDVFDNDNITTKSTWGKRRIPLSAYFIRIFEEIGFNFVDDIIWDKGEVQSERHKNGNKPYPFYQYPMNCYEHILVFHKHRLDNYRYPCPICGSLNVNGNSYSSIGIKSWECKNNNCSERSVSNRGKRFSMKSIMTQGSQKKENEIENEFIYSWRRDIKKINPVIKINSKGKNIIGHTAPFPTEIPEYAIKMFSYPGDIILDPFAGSGTTQIVSVQNNRIGLGIDKELKHIEAFKKHNKKNNIDIENYYGDRKE